jgi:DNA topoisomerase-2
LWNRTDTHIINVTCANIPVLFVVVSSLSGDSAKALAVSGLAVVGRDRYGVFPLKGKMLNVREASASQMMANSEVTALKQILGLQSGKKYTSTKELRYGRVMIMADQDHDGSHIKGLVINLFAHCWPSLLQLSDSVTGSFLWEFITPIVRVSKGYSESGASLSKNAKEILFYSIPDYEEWTKEQGIGETSTTFNSATGNTKGWNIKYYKGLGTSTSTEAKAYFSELGRHQIEFAWDDTAAQKLELAFGGKAADARKEWLGKYERSQGGIDQSGNGQKIDYSTFVDKELILFSMASNQRAIPSLIDGLKPGQRKILYCSFKRNLKREVKVAQLAGYVSEHSAYHHGESSLCSTIVGMAQNFVGNNNVHLLLPNGQFGTRLQGGKDAASPRYIFTTLSPVTRAAFPASDDALLTYISDDGQSVEPEWYIPVLPLALVNGSAGIGTGWSSDVPNYNPREITGQIRKMIEIQNEIIGDRDFTSAELAAPPAVLDAKLEAAFITQLSELAPWYKGFRGVIKFKSVGRFVVKGVLERLGPNTLHISELPLHTWTGDYKTAVLEALLATGEIKEFREYHTDTSVSFVVEFTPEQMTTMESEGPGGLYRKMKLNSSLATTNMVLFSRDGHLKRYSSPNEILREFFSVRMEYYHRRKAALIEASRKEQDKLANKVRFIRAVCGLSDETMHVMNKSKKNIVAQLDKGKYLRIPKKKAQEYNNTAEEGVDASADMDRDEGDEFDASSAVAASSSAKPRASDFDYLMSMDIWALTKEKAAALAAELAASQAALRVLEHTSASQMWLDDLDVFEKALDKQEEEEKQMEHEAAEKSRLKRLKAAGSLTSSKKLKLAAAAAAAIKGEIIVDTSDDFDETKVKITRKRKTSATAGDGDEVIGNEPSASKKRNPKKQKRKGSNKSDGVDNMEDNNGPCAMNIDNDNAVEGTSKKKRGLKPKKAKPVKEEEEVIVSRVRLPRATALKVTTYTEDQLSGEEDGGDFNSDEDSGAEKKVDRAKIVDDDDNDAPMRAFSGAPASSSEDEEEEKKQGDKVANLSSCDVSSNLESTQHKSAKPKNEKKGYKRKARKHPDSDDDDAEERSDIGKTTAVELRKNKKRRANAKNDKLTPAAAASKKTVSRTLSSAVKLKYVGKRRGMEESEVDISAEEITDDDYID